ncbi:NYN domain-containing protein [Singulisphaera sp. PoT]|uniref:NYN domain-containing protein n=1 Tax=Singulisphaera sp. PoT TaxID=3411797 RepID=UPI003BF4B402
MRFLIDGYNLMHAQGLMGKRFGLDGFRKARTRFLNDLHDGLGPIEAHLTTVVFDALDPPREQPREMKHKGISVIYAVSEDSADDRIEQLIAKHSSPKNLSVISSDNRIRIAASRRKAKVFSADEFLEFLQSRRRQREEPSKPLKPEPPRERLLSEAESAFWQEEFRSLEELPETREVFQNPLGIPTDAEIAEIEREIEREFERRYGKDI